MYSSSSDNKNLLDAKNNRNAQNLFLRFFRRKPKDNNDVKVSLNSNNLSTKKRDSRKTKIIENLENHVDSTTDTFIHVEKSTLNMPCIDSMSTTIVNSIELESVTENINSGCSSSVPERICEICFVNVTESDLYTISSCGCQFCLKCIQEYVRVTIDYGVVSIPCLTINCKNSGFITVEEIEKLIGKKYADQFRQFLYLRDIESDPTRSWCPTPDCETVCNVPQKAFDPVICPTCDAVFCSFCSEKWHPNLSCKELETLLMLDNDTEKNDSSTQIKDAKIKRCPNCRIPIERLEGCAQMMCNRCQHVFCWFCLKALDDDYLLRHYSNGPCKNLLGHSRSSLFWHRTVISLEMSSTDIAIFVLVVSIDDISIDIHSFISFRYVT
ncbi:putative E3 ubiquitin-protein ligase [Nymphon striatum]|nr:putative E3 ubiquitin-protein ligase [Nymphon striatum]